MSSRSPFVEELVPAPDPARCCELLAALPYRLFLDSAAKGTRLGRYSFLTADPVAVVRSKGARTECVDLSSGTRRVVSGDALDAVRALLAPHAAEPVAGLPPFQGGAAGYLAYDWGRVLERLPAPRHEDLTLPDVVFGVYDWVLAWDHDAVASMAHLDWSPGNALRRREDSAPSSAPRPSASVCGPTAVPPSAGTARGSIDGMTLPPRPAPAPSFPVEDGWWDESLALRSSFTHHGYLDAVARVREYIFAGDIFQANLSQRFEAPLGEPSWTLYRRLRTRNAAPFAAYLDFPDVTVLSASPERFLRVDVGGHVETRPIKGTRPRGVGPEHDLALGVALAVSAKDQAENLMIVDLMRNDLSRVCAPGTVRVAELFGLEHYATVHHLVSTVVGDLTPGSRCPRPACARHSPAAPLPVRPRFARWRSSPSSNRPSGASTAGRSATGASRARSTAASPSARRWRWAAAYTSAPAAGSSPIRIPNRSTARPSTRLAV